MAVIENEVKFIRLVTGEDILAEYVEVDDKNVSLVNPMKVLYTSTNTGHMTISLMQWVFTRISTDQTFNLPVMNILVSSKPTDNLVSYYWETVDHFFNKKVETSFEEQSEEELDDAFMNLDDENGLEVLKELLQSMSDKRKLH